MRKIKAKRYDDKFYLEQESRILDINDIAKNREQNITWVNSKNSKGETPLHIAARNHKYTLFQTMLPYCTDIAVCDNLGNSILHALLNFHIKTQEFKKLSKLVNEVISRGANPNRENLSGITPIQLAIMHCNTDIFETFKAAKTSGYDLNSKDEKGNTILHYAVKSSNYKMVIDLIKRGADLNVKNDKGYSILHSAVKFCNEKMVKILVKHGAEINSKTSDDKLTPLHLAIQEDSKSIAKILIKAGARIDAKNANFQTTLDMAVLSNSTKAIKCLIDHGVNVNHVEVFAPLHIALLENCEESFVYLINIKGIDLNIKSKHGLTPLHIAAAFGNFNFVKALIDREADFNVVDKNGYTPLHIAICYSKGSDYSVYYRADHEINKLLKPTYNDHEEIVDLLIKSGCNVNALTNRDESPLYQAVDTGNAKLVEVLIEHKAMVNCAEKIFKETPLHRALLNRCEHIALTLIFAGADVNALTIYGNSPLHYTSIKILVNMLIKHDAKVNCAESNLGLTPLHNACSQNCEVGVAEALIKAGADVNVLTKNGISPLHMAIQENKLEILRLLIERGAILNCKKNRCRYRLLYMMTRNGGMKDFKMADVNFGDTWLHSTVLELKEQKHMETLICLCALVNLCEKDSCMPVNEIKSRNHSDFSSELLSQAIKLFGMDNIDDFYAFSKFDCHSTTFKIENQIHQFKFRHLQRKRTLVLPVNNSLSNHADKDAIFSYFLNSNIVRHDPKYISEVEEMKNFFIKDNISLHKLLHMNRKNRCSYAKILDLRKIEELFPIYYEMILACYNDAILRGALIKVAQTALCRLMNFELPILCSEEICSNLSVINLIAVIQAGDVFDENLN